MRSSACDTHFRHCVRSVLCWLAFPLAPALGSTGSAVAGTTLFVGFLATMAESDFSRPCIIGYGRAVWHGVGDWGHQYRRVHGPLPSLRSAMPRVISFQPAGV